MLWEGCRVSSSNGPVEKLVVGTLPFPRWHLSWAAGRQPDAAWELRLFLLHGSLWIRVRLPTFQRLDPPGPVPCYPDASHRERGTSEVHRGWDPNPPP